MKLRRQRQSTWRGVTAGLLGGFVGSWAMAEFQLVWSKASEKINEHGGSQQQQTQESQESSEDASMEAADRLSLAVAGKSLNKDQKKAAGPVVHYVFGTAMGGLYGAMVEHWRGANYAAGLPFGATLFAAADEIAVPALGLSEPPNKVPLSSHAYGLASHFVYGLSTEAVRWSSRKLLQLI